MNAMVNIALPKGRLGEKVYQMFEVAGFDCPSIRETNRKLIFENEKTGVRFFWVKPSDVAIYVERGAADIGVAGKDILLEYEPKVYELLDLNLGKCRMAVAAKKEFRDDPAHYEDRRHTHVIAPFAVPRGWTVGRSFDWGYDKPFSCGWWAIDYEGRIYRILEWYGCTDQPDHGLHLTPDEVFERIAQMEKEHPLLQGRRIEGVADPALWNAQTGESFAECAARHGVYFRKADNHRITGWMQCHYRLLFDEEGLPGLYVFSSCRDFIRTIPLLCYDPRKPEDVDTTQEDHIADEWRYFMMTRPIAPQLKEEPVIPPVNPLER